MNHYPHHLGDYDGSTAHLSWLEDMAYTRLLRLYYRTEKPLPWEIKDVCRLVRAHSKQEVKAVETVLKEFFSMADDGWHNKRADAELAVYREKISKASASAKTRWAQSERNANAPPNAMRTHSEGNANQNQEPEPLTKTKEERERSPSGSRLMLCELPEAWKVYCAEKRPELNPESVWENFSSYWKAKAGKDARKVDWDLTWQRWVREERGQGMPDYSAVFAKIGSQQ